MRIMKIQEYTECFLFIIIYTYLRFQMDTFGLSVEFQTIKAEKIILEETLVAIQTELQTLRDSDRERILKDAKYVRLEAKYNEGIKYFNERVNALENSEKAKSETVEELVSEYSKLAAEVERERNDDKKKRTELSRINETLTFKVTALEQAISAFADKSSRISTDQQHESESANALRAALTQIDQLAFQLAIKEEELNKLVDEIVHLNNKLSNFTNNQDESNIRQGLYQDDENLTSTALKEAENSVINLKSSLSTAIKDKQLLECASTKTIQLLEEKLEINEQLQKSLSDEAPIVVLQKERNEAVVALKLMEDKLKRLEDEGETSKSLTASLNQQIEDMEKNMNDKVELINAENNEKSIKSQIDHDAVIQKMLDTHRQEFGSLKSQLQESKDADQTEALQSSQSQHDRDILALHEKLKIAVQNASKYKTDSETQKHRITELKHQHELDKERMNLKLAEAESKAIESNMEKVAEAFDIERDNLRKKLEAEFTRKEMEYKDTATAFRERTLTELKAKHEEEKRIAITDLNKAFEERLLMALKELRASKEQEAHTTILELNNALQDQVEKGNAEVEAMQLFQQSLVNEAEKARDAAKSDLQNVEERFIQREKQALKLKENQVRSEMERLVDAAYKEKAEYLELYNKENKARKTIHNKLLELQGNIRVICRVRPFLDIETKIGEDVDVTSFPSDEDIMIQRDVVTKTRYEYDRVFTPSSVQEEIFKEVQPLCISVLDGYNICIFAYGQTGSGKTYTMQGSDAISMHWGVSPRAVYEIFRLINQMKDKWEYTVQFCMLEIYNETIRDLLISSDKMKKCDKPLDVRQTTDGNVVPGLTEEIVNSPDQVYDLMKKANGNRAVGSHDMNEHSSRSHSILTMICKGKNKYSSNTTYGKLNLIDLAGSERVSKTDATGERLKEAQNINRSLSALGDVINALSNKKSTHVPYRNSKLTFLLQDSLGGNSKCLMFVNISPAIYNLGETVCSLNFASRCRNVELGAASKQSCSSTSGSGNSGNVNKIGSSNSVNKMGAMGSLKK